MRLTIGKKIYGITIFAAVALLAMASISLFVTRGLIKESERMVNEDVAKLDFAMEAQKGLGEAIHAFKNYLLRKDDKYLPQFKEAADQMDQSLKGYLKLASGEERLLGEKAVPLLEAYKPVITALVEARSKSDNIAQVDKAVKGADRPLMAAFKAMEKASDKKLSENRKEANAYASRIIYLQLFAALLAVALVSVTSVLVTRNIQKGVHGVGTVVAQVAEGDLTRQVAVVSDDELGDMGRDFNNMLTTLNKMIATISSTSVQVASAASQLYSTSEQMATGAEEVAAQTGTVATAGEEMAATSAEIAQNCNMAAGGARQANDAALGGAAVVQETVSVMNRIAERVRESALTVGSLGERSDQIGAIIGTIEDIADQTNLLALNAAIEAARAGEQGRGFAVVADEVRALAERTTKATREIGEMIKAIQGETRGAVGAMEEGVKEVEKGTSEAAKSGQALQEILDQINGVTMQVSQIATAAEQQTATTNEINNNIQQITQVVQETSNGAHESATAASRLSALAEELQQLVKRFKLAA